jgi:AcrR family transcriptional regulator
MKPEPYHHGDLRRALMAEAVKVIAEQGPPAVSLRDLARRVGVSHAAPRHHFGDKAGLLTAVATEGFLLLAAELRTAQAQTGSFLEVGVAYVQFAVNHPAYFEVMYRPDIYRANDPALLEARSQTRGALYGPLGENPAAGVDPDLRAAGVAAWSLVHGLASLLVTGNLPQELGQDPAAITRAVAAHLSVAPGRTEDA